MQESLTTSSLNLPSEPQTERDLLVLIRAGGGFVDIRALGKQTAPARPIAEALERSLAGTALGKHVEYSGEDDYACARASVSTGSFGATEGSQSVPLGALVAGLTKAGYIPHVLLSTPFYAQTDTPRSLPVRRSTKNTWLDATRAEPGLVVHVSANVSPATPYLAAFFVLFVPLIGALGILTAVLVARSSSLPVEKRRALYPKLAMWPTFGAIGLHAPFAVWYMTSGGTRPVADLWFGSVSAASAFAPMMMVGMLTLFPVLLLTGKVERKLFGPAKAESGEPAPAPGSFFVPSSLFSSEERAARVRLVRYTMIPTALGLLWIFFGARLLGLKGSAASISAMAGMLFSAIGSNVIRFVLGKKLLLPFSSAPSEDSALTARATHLAERAGVTLSRVRIDESALGRSQANAAYLPPGTVQVSRRALDVMTPAQLDFLLAHELSHKKKAHVARQLVFLLPMLVVMALPIILSRSGGVSGLSQPVLFVALLLPLLAIPFIFLVGNSLRRARELEADRGALELTRDLPAAMSALSVLQKNSPLPHIHDIDLLSHPAMARRIANLKSVAAELGLKEERVGYDMASRGEPPSRR